MRPIFRNALLGASVIASSGMVAVGQQLDDIKKETVETLSSLAHHDKAPTPKLTAAFFDLCDHSFQKSNPGDEYSLDQPLNKNNFYCVNRGIPGAQPDVLAIREAVLSITEVNSDEVLPQFKQAVQDAYRDKVSEVNSHNQHQQPQSTPSSNACTVSTTTIHDLESKVIELNKRVNQMEHKPADHIRGYPKVAKTHPATQVIQ